MNLTTVDDDTLIQEMADDMMKRLNYCGCGQPDWFLYYLYIYLSKVSQKSKVSKEANQITYKTHGDLYAYAYLCDKMEWTDHGSSVCWAFLTDKGKIELNKLKRVSWEEYKKFEENK